MNSHNEPKFLYPHCSPYIRIPSLLRPHEKPTEIPVNSYCRCLNLMDLHQTLTHPCRMNIVLQAPRLRWCRGRGCRHVINMVGNVWPMWPFGHLDHGQPFGQRCWWNCGIQPIQPFEFVAIYILTDIPWHTHCEQIAGTRGGYVNIWAWIHELQGVGRATNYIDSQCERRAGHPW